MPDFQLVAPFQPTGDQPQAIERLVEGVRAGQKHQVLMGATGTGKTVTLQVLAEAFSARGVPVFLADVKGDLAGLSQPGKPHPKIDKRVATIGMPPPVLAASPVVFWDVFGKGGHHLRTTVSEQDKVVDVHEELFGFREVTIEGPGIYINGVRRNFWNWVDVHASLIKRPEEWADAFHQEKNRFMTI